MAEDEIFGWGENNKAQEQPKAAESLKGGSLLKRVSEPKSEQQPAGQWDGGLQSYGQDRAGGVGSISKGATPGKRG